jgi:DNA repair protein SbcC/Rad50
MIIGELKLNPFAGLAKQDLQFTQGLNVVVGPNEAGKSTIVNALKMALFLPTQYSKTQFNKEISRYMPLAGGDTIQVELAFIVDPKKETYRLFKSWGAKTESRLVMPGGGLFTQPQAVQEKLRELLVLKEGTYHTVLFAYQSHLGTTLEALREEPEPRHNLADLLRRAIYETDRVSVDLLEQRLDERMKQLFSRWDENLAAPQGNRGIENPWLKDVGEILRAYYQKESLRRDLQSAQEYEGQLDTVNERIRLVAEELESLKVYVGTNQKLVADARQRLLLEANLKVFREEEGKLKELCRKWPVLEKEVKDGPAALERLRNKRAGLDDELSRTQAYESQKEARDRFKQAETKHEALGKARAALLGLKTITTKDIEALEELNLQLAECRASLKAGKLSLNFTPAVPMTVQAAKDLEAESEYVLKVDQALELDAGGLISLRHPDWQLTVKSGEAEFEQLAKEHKQATMGFQDLLKRLGVQDLTSAKEAHEEYKAQVNAIKGLDDDLEEILGGQSFEDLQAAVQQALQTPPPRPTAEVALKLGELKAILSQAEKDLSEKQDQLAQWQETYKSLDSLVEKLADTRGEVKKLEIEVAKLEPLPPEIEDLEAFIREFEGQAVQIEKKQKAWHDLLLERSELQGQAPNETVEEIVPQLREAESRFDDALKEGAALITIQDAFAQVKAAMDCETLTPWLEDLKQLLTLLTGGRYVTLEFPSQESESAVRQDGLRVPGFLLSAGARVSLGLAVRLSMASHFLRGLSGFLVLDDPLVDLDDVGRQQAAVKVIQEFAREKQTIVLTCKEGHAQLLGGHRIDL